MANMIPISTVTVGSGGASSIDFTNIPQIYTDLIIKISLRSSWANTQDRLYLKFNGVTTSYTMRYVGNAAGSAVSYTEASYGNNFAGYIDADSNTSNTFSNIEYYIPNYAGSNYKSGSFDATMEDNSTTQYMGLGAFLWSNTSPITSIGLYPTTGPNLKQYSSATLYGIRKY